VILEVLASVSRDYKGDIIAGFLYFNSGLLLLFNYLHYIHLLIIYILLLLLYNYIHDLVSVFFSLFLLLLLYIYSYNELTRRVKILYQVEVVYT